MRNLLVRLIGMLAEEDLEDVLWILLQYVHRGKAERLTPYEEPHRSDH